MSARPDYPMTSRTLDNGLRVVVSPNPGLGVVAVNLWYGVGSRHEDVHRQGFAHLFEHLMFQGSRHVRPAEHFSLLQANGASLNATTSFDRTNYFESMPAGVLDLALWLEADRMAYLDDVLTEQNFANQVKVVGEERNQRMDNVPYGTVFERVLPFVFPPEHPYGHLPIGSMAHLQEATLEEVSSFHGRFYMPNNAVLSVVGDVTDDEAFAKVEAQFAHIHAGGAPTWALPEPLPPVEQPIRVEVEEDVPAPAVWFAGRLPADAPEARDLAAVILAASILGDGETSLLHRRLVRQDEIALSAGVGVNALVAGNSLAVATVRALPGQDLAAVVEAATDVVRGFAERGPTSEQLQVARMHAEREWLDDMATAAGRADAISGCALLFNHPEVLNERLPLLQSVSAEQVQAAAQAWLVPMLDVEFRVIPNVSSGAEGDPAPSEQVVG